MRIGKPRLQIHIFGRPQLGEDGVPRPFKAPPRALALLVYLLLKREAPSARESLAFAFWPDLPEADARTKLRDYLRSLRSALPAEASAPWLVADNRSIQWNPQAAVQLDLADYEQLVSSPATMDQAVELYRGDLAEGIDESWLDAPRSRFREMQTATLLTLIERCRGDSDSRALLFAQQLIVHDPFREDAVRAVIELRAKLGDRAGAVQAYQQFAQRLEAELGVSPMAETKWTYDSVRVAETPETNVVRHNLPANLTTFVGRDDMVTLLHDLVARRRLVTLTGAGGVGKTRLAIETARTILSRFPDGVWLVELASVTDPVLIGSTIAYALRLAGGTEGSLSTILREKSALLVIDNCEHLAQATAVAVERLLNECPGLHILATSREALRASGERALRVDSLSHAAAAQLFIDRADDVAPGPLIAGGDAAEHEVLLTIARRLDGIPLAIELAAARTNSLSLRALALALDDSFALLTGGRRTVLPRQQTLRATLDWSYDLLTAAEQHVLARLSVFAGGWTQSAADAVCADAAVTQARLIGIIASLVDKSLVVTDNSREQRYYLLQTTREYAWEHLSADRRAHLAHLHATYFSQLARQFDTTWGFVESQTGLAKISPELDNFRAALGWSLKHQNDRNLAVGLVGSLRWFFAARALNVEGVRWCEVTLASLGPVPQPEHEAAVQLALAASMGTSPLYPRFHYYRAADSERFIVAAERAAELNRACGDQEKLCLALSMAAMHLHLANRPEDADRAASEAIGAGQASNTPLALTWALYSKSFTVDRDDFATRTSLLKEALVQCRDAKPVYNRYAVLHALGEVAFASGDAETALAYAHECLAAEVGMVSSNNRAQAQINVAAYSLAVGKIDEARSAAQEALLAATRAGDSMITSAAFENLAAVAAISGDCRLAARLQGYTEAQRPSGLPRLFTEQSGLTRTNAALRAHFSAKELQVLFDQGRGWSFAQAAEHAKAI